MKNLFAPWRLEFIKGKREEGCVFCKLPGKREKTRDNLILCLGQKSFVIMNRYPYNSGHLLVVPYRHTNDLVTLTREENLEIAFLLQQSHRILSEVSRPDGMNLGMNLGAAAGAGIKEHLHWHILPRWYGDTNFLPVLTDTRSIPELIADSYDRLLVEFEKVGPTPSFPEDAAGTGTSRGEKRP